MLPSFVATRFTEDKLPFVQGFTCTTETWCIQAAKFITSHDTVQGSALWSINHHDNEVFLYLAGTDLVGFASLGVASWQIPPPNGPRTRLAYIPQIAIATAFQGQPSDVDRQQRYSHLILGDIIERALLIEDVDSICLRVHPNNSRAIRLYESFDFHLMDERDGLRRMIRFLR